MRYAGSWVGEKSRPGRPEVVRLAGLSSSRTSGYGARGGEMVGCE